MTDQKITKINYKLPFTVDGIEYKGHGIYMCSDPEFVGAMPVRSDITILPTDTNDKKVGWTVENEFSGYEAFIPNTETTINTKDGLVDGMSISIMFDMLATVHKAKNGHWYWETEKSFGYLEFSKDSRKCWTSPIIISKKVASPNSYYDYYWFNALYSNISNFFVNIGYDIKSAYYKKLRRFKKTSKDY